MMPFRLLLCFVFLAASPVLASAKALTEKEQIRQQAEADCYDDVNKLCGDDIPDEDKIKDCMKAKRVQLSSACRKDFDKGLLIEKQ